VVEGVGDHGCEYMTGGKVVILGKTGRNFAAGMSGGVAYVLDSDNTFDSLCNKQMVGLERLEDSDEIESIQAMVKNHVKLTGSQRGKSVLELWDEMVPKFVKVIPHDYKRMLIAIKRARESGLSGDDAIMSAFEENANNMARVGGN